MSAPARVGWCPGALRPMASGDGLILRVKPRGSRLDLAQARAIAEVSRRHGNGALDLTNHANLQIRGVSPTSLDAVVAVLDAAGLIDPNSAAEAVRNIIASPLAGLDPEAILDIRPVVAALERRLVEDETLHRLPAKFTTAIDDGGAFGLGGVPADIRFEAVRVGNAPAFAVRLARGRDVEFLCDVTDVVETFAALAQIFIASNAADPEMRRMRHLVGRDGAAALFARAGLGAVGPSSLAGEGRDARSSIGHVAPGVLGVAAPFGRLDADQFDAIVVAAAEAGASELRITPWRSILAPGLSAEGIVQAAARCDVEGLVVDAADSRLAVAACPGAPGCHRGSTPVLEDAAHVAETWRASMPTGDIALHVSGCAKGCAHPAPAPLTLVARDGLYDLVIEGKASDAPTVRGLTIEDAARWLQAPPMRERWA